MITTLLKAGAAIKAQNKDGSTALMLAARNNQNADVVSTLLRAGGDIEGRDKDGWTPLILAAGYSKKPEVVMTLLKAGANAKAKNSEGMTAYDYAQSRENLKDTDALRRLEEAAR